MDSTPRDLRATLRDVIHRTNNHLGGVVSMAEILEGSTEDERTRRIAERILRSCEDLRAYLQEVRSSLPDRSSA